jgi:hypothetical protein
MPRNQREWIKALQDAGWTQERGGKHVVKMTKKGERPITLPQHRGQTYSKISCSCIGVSRVHRPPISRSRDMEGARSIHAEAEAGAITAPCLRELETESRRKELDWLSGDMPEIISVRWKSALADARRGRFAARSGMRSHVASRTV